MAIDPQLLAFMPHTVTISVFTSKNNYGEDQVGSARTARAYVESNQTIRNGNETVEELRPIRAYVADIAITLRDRITLPDGSQPEISSIEIYTVIAGLEHTVVSFL